jgi:hypothetical protein
MAFWTVQDVFNKVDRDLDLQNEDFVNDTEFFTYVNDALRDLVATMIKLGVDDRYYMTKANLSLIQGTEEYSLPANIYANKILRVVYSSQSDIYAIKRIRGKYEFEMYHDANRTPASNPKYKYMLLNSGATTGYKLLLVPTAQETSSNVVIWYVREHDKPLLMTDVVDCPEEFIQFVIQHVKVSCIKKDLGNPMIQLEYTELDRVRKDLAETLTDQTHDGDNEITQDLSIYEEMV